MFEEFITHRVKVVSLDGKEFHGAVLEVEGNFIKLRNANNIYIINTKYIGYIKNDNEFKQMCEPINQGYGQTDQDPNKYPAAGYQYPARVAAKVTPRNNEFSMELPTTPDDTGGGGPQLVRQAERSPYDTSLSAKTIERDRRSRK